MQLNKFLAHAGVCSRRQAVDIIKDGHVKVNGTVQTNPAYRVQPEDSVKYRNKVLRLDAPIYILLNKPAGYITTVSDDLGRRTVMDLVGTATKKRLYPIGRLDKETTGLLILTNDGDMAQKLAHPQFQSSKKYQVTLNRSLEPSDAAIIRKGVKLEDGVVKVDKLSINPDAPFSVSVELHSGKNRIVRRIFEHFGYHVNALDRSGYAGLTKRNVPKGRWRFLTNSEIKKLRGE